MSQERHLIYPPLMTGSYTYETDSALSFDQSESILLIQPKEAHDPFTQREIPYSDCTDKAFETMLKQDARNFMLYVILMAQKSQQETGSNYFVITLEPNTLGNEIFSQLEQAIKANLLAIPQGLNIQLDQSVYNSNSSPSSISTVPCIQNPNANNTIQFGRLLGNFKTYAQQNKVIGYKPLSLKEQIAALTTTSGQNGNIALTDWQICLTDLLKDAGKDESKREKVASYITATQTILKNPNDTQSLENLLNELSSDCENENLRHAAVKKAALFILAVIFGSLVTAATAINPIFGFTLLFGGVIIGVTANFAGETNNDGGRLSEGISWALGKLGLFKSTELKEHGSNLLNSINNNNMPVTDSYGQHKSETLTPVYN